MRTQPLSFLFALSLAATACGGHEPRPAQPAAITAATAPAETLQIPRRLELYGTVEAERSAAVSSRVMGNVVAVRVKAGDSVAAGEVLVEIDPQTARGQEAQARGALAQAQGALTLAERNHGRFQALAKSGSASELELDMARMQWEQAKGAVAQARGAVESASSVANESRVLAPFAGRVAARLVEPGDFAAPGRPLVTVESAAGRRLVLSVPESVAGEPGLALGSRLAVSIDALGKGELTGAVVERAPGADPASHTFRVKVEVAAANVPSGVAGRAFLETGARKTVVVPRAAVLPQGGISMVVVRDAEGKARSRAVTLGGEIADGRVEVLAGLAGGETLLTGLAAPPEDGAPVVTPVAGALR